MRPRKKMAPKKGAANRAIITVHTHVKTKEGVRERLCLAAARSNVLIPRQ